MQSAQILKIKKEHFLKIVTNKLNNKLQEFALDKMKFLKSRINYLVNNDNSTLFDTLSVVNGDALKN